MQAGYYTILEVDEDGLTIKPSAHAIAEQAEFLERSFYEVQAKLLDGHLAKGWD